MNDHVGGEQPRPKRVVRDPDARAIVDRHVGGSTPPRRTAGHVEKAVADNVVTRIADAVVGYATVARPDLHEQPAATC